jgi:hypothetical protein
MQTMAAKRPRRDAPRLDERTIGRVRIGAPRQSHRRYRSAVDRGSWLAWIAVLMGACFSESPTTEGGCDPGAAGCRCASGQCDAALECVQDLELCIPAGCDPGTQLCTCHDGECFGELHCEGGLCRPVDGTGGGTGGGTLGSSTGGGTIAEATTSTMTDSAESTAGSTVTATDATTVTATDATTMTTTAEDTGMPQTTGGAETGVDGEPCHACILNADMGGNACEMFVVGCNAGECLSLATCVTDCLDNDDPSCIAGCCMMHPGGVDSYGDLATCWATECAMSCVGFELQC